ncbi:hypothetical protein SLH49_11510 [Cognatiyoonia sp. IB215446]|uniref:hypothetical protein n=1 Tax=Cognatiyoonia sp. IB215446 TaxID=3097355 RepID=UPI002A102BB9|nr:hypothetical protein [Cognatiyoonia sp. IB215446]MDX8348611.1 hypothetical protein [Cognatiyoonia sp. IB215446]
MTDYIDQLKAKIRAATPRPNVARKAKNLGLAHKNYQNLQGSRELSRPRQKTIPKPPKFNG